MQCRYSNYTHAQGRHWLKGNISIPFTKSYFSTLRTWFDTIPNDGLLRFYTAGSGERLVVTTPEALSELLVQRAYDFVKPDQFRASLERVVGVGLLLAEGDEHRVRHFFFSFNRRVLRLRLYDCSSNGKIFDPHSHSGISRIYIRFSGPRVSRW